MPFYTHVHVKYLTWVHSLHDLVIESNPLKGDIDFKTALYKKVGKIYLCKYFNPGVYFGFTQPSKGHSGNTLHEGLIHLMGHLIFAIT